MRGGLFKLLVIVFLSGCAAPKEFPQAKRGIEVKAEYPTPFETTYEAVRSAVRQMGVQVVLEDRAGDNATGLIVYRIDDDVTDSHTYANVYIEGRDGTSVVYVAARFRERFPKANERNLFLRVDRVLSARKS